MKICNLDEFGSISTIILVCVVCNRPFASVQSLASLKKKKNCEGRVRGERIVSESYQEIK